MIPKFFLLVILVTTNEVFGDTLSTATLEEFPYMGIVAGTYSCPAILISEKHVLVPGQCVSGKSEVTVFFGNHHFPTMTAPQSYKSSNIYIHERFQNQTNERYYMYDDDIAIIEIDQPISQSNTVRPGTLISTEIANELNEGAIVGEVGWFRGRDTLMQGTLVMRPSSTCTSIFGYAFSSSKEWCFQESSSDSLSYVGNVMTADSMVAGLMTKSNNCVSTGWCTQTYVFLNLAYYSDWISNKVQMSNSQSKIETLAKRVKETNEKFERETVSINTKLEKILNTIQNMERSQSDMFDYKIQEIKEEINNVRSQKDQHSDERDSKYDQKFQEVNNTLKIFERKFYDKIKEVNNRINDEISQNSENMEGKLERQNNVFLDLGKQVQKTKNEITNVGNDERIHYKNLQKEIKDLKTEINTIKIDQVMKDDEIELKLNTLRDHASNKQNNRLDDLETQINLLSMEMGSMNTTINKILEYIGKNPASN